MKKILIPTDFSPCAEAAARVALMLAKKSDAELYYLHLHSSGNGTSHVPHLGTQAHRQADQVTGHIRGEMNRLVLEAEREAVKATPLLVFNKGNDKIENYIEPFMIDLIVMGSHGVRGIREFVFGSMAQRLIRHSSVPVLVVKNPLVSNEFKNILFASAFEEEVDGPLEFITGFAKYFQAKIHLLYVNMVAHPVDGGEAKAEMDMLANRFPETYFTENISETNDQEWAISQSAIKIGADLIAITSPDIDGLTRIFSHTVAEKLVNHEEMPVLVIPVI